ncbi:hypothetical protein [Granulicella sp. L60]|jgi:hypothetical protein|uniref:hypothetical protein n=1 Tax=Granulicella sp. L60 TaxID=1641866 RepID=UPI00131C794F|nr:hypothetical protein [Granulicella sp. L60]
MTIHLSHEQLCDLIFADPSLQPPSRGPQSFEQHPADAGSDVVQQHLQACVLCSSELKSLRDSLANFRDASISFAHQEYAQSYAQRSSIAPPHRYLSQPLYWAAAMVVIVASLFPLTMHRDHAVVPISAKTASTSQQTTESDDQLLADIDQKVSADVPSAMEPLADPTAEASTTSSNSDQRKN